MDGYELKEAVRRKIRKEEGRQCKSNVTLRRVLVTVVVVDTHIKYYIF
jgi:hypothetical protein